MVAFSRPQSNRHWFHNFNYESKHTHGSEVHFLGVTMTCEFTGLTPIGDRSYLSQVVDGAKFHSCRYRPDEGILLFYLTDEEDLPPIIGHKCRCCDLIASVIPE